MLTPLDPEEETTEEGEYVPSLKPKALEEGPSSEERHTLEYLASKSPFGIPDFLVQAVDFLCVYGMYTPGIYRIPGDADMILAANQRIKNGASVEEVIPSSATEEEMVYLVASLLKGFFRDLKLPILPQKVYDELINRARSNRDVHELAVEMRRCFEENMDETHYLALGYLITFVHFQSSYVEHTKMSAQNLSIVWAPNLIRSNVASGDPMREINELPISLKLMLTMITHAHVVFPSESMSALPPCFSYPQAQTLSVEEIALSLTVSHVNEEVEVIPESLEEVDKLSVNDLKQYLSYSGVDPSEVLDKQELLARARQCFNRSLRRQVTLSNYHILNKKDMLRKKIQSNFQSSKINKMTGKGVPYLPIPDKKWNSLLNNAPSKKKRKNLEPKLNTNLSDVSRSFLRAGKHENKTHLRKESVQADSRVGDSFGCCVSSSDSCC